MTAPAPHSQFLKRALQAAFVAFAVAASATRVVDRRHHWWDVAAGSAFGAALAYLAIKYFCRDFQNDWSALLTSQSVSANDYRDQDKKVS